MTSWPTVPWNRLLPQCADGTRRNARSCTSAGQRQREPGALKHPHNYNAILRQLGERTVKEWRYEWLATRV
jgi:hypothetical protein